MDKTERSHDTVSHYNKLFAENKFVFKPVTDISLYNCDRLRWVVNTQFKIEVNDPIYKEVLVFKFPEAKIRYLLYDPLTENEHWTDENFDDVHFNEAKAYFASHDPVYTDSVLRKSLEDIDKIIKAGGKKSDYTWFYSNPKEVISSSLEIIFKQLFDDIDADKEPGDIIKYLQQKIFELGAKRTGMDIDALKIMYEMLGINFPK